jgi:hypothetical protein
LLAAAALALPLVLVSAVAANTVGFGAQTGGPTCVTVPVTITRSTATPARSASVTIQLDANLVLCSTPATSILRGPWLDTWGSVTPFFSVASLGGGRYQIDQVVIGSPCGPTGNAVMFTVDVAKANPGVTTGAISILSPTMSDCASPPGAIALTIGTPATVTFPPVTPLLPITGFTATKVDTGNDTDGTARVRFTFTLPAGATRAEIYAAPFTNYPEFDDPSPFATTRRINFQNAAGTLPLGFEHDFGNVFTPARGYGWNATTPTTSRNLNPGDPGDGFAWAFNSDPGSATWRFTVPSPGSYQVRVMCGDALTQQRAVVNVENVQFLSNVLTQGGQYTEATQTVTVIDGELTVRIGGAFANTPPLSHTKINLIEIGSGTGGPPGTVPPTATTFPPPLGYALFGDPTTSPADFDTPLRDYYYFVAYAKDDVSGARSTAVALPNGLLNYHLGDVFHGTPLPEVACAGDNVVNVRDLSFLAANYNLVLPPGDSRACLDFCPLYGPGVTAGLPVTDNLVDFQDFSCLAANYGVVSKTIAQPTPAAENSIRVEPVEAGSDEVHADLHMRADGTLRTVSVRLAWDESVVRPIGSVAGAFLEAQGGVTLQPSPGSVDYAVLGARDLGLAGEGVMASVRFRRISTGDPRLHVETVRAVDLSGNLAQVATSEPTDAGGTPRATALLGGVPNPFNPSTRISFVVAARQNVRLSIYALDGRLVRELVRGERDAGAYDATWDGTDQHGVRVASGVYYARFAATDGTWSKPLVLVK